jgi:hypothetical protein
LLLSRWFGLGPIQTWTSRWFGINLQLKLINV